jgi:hypothetical protein
MGLSRAKNITTTSSRAGWITPRKKTTLTYYESGKRTTAMTTRATAIATSRWPSG